MRLTARARLTLSQTALVLAAGAALTRHPGRKRTGGVPASAPTAWVWD
ncbi:hypothetical protein [Nonomuraea jabiensis]